jgi:hypothetical protein
MRKHHDRRPLPTVKGFGRGAIGTPPPYSGYKMYESYVVQVEHSVQSDADTKHEVSLLACPESGPHSSRRLRVDATDADYTSQSVRKDTKPYAEPCMSAGKTFVPGWYAISFCGQTWFWAIAVKGCFTLDNNRKGPNVAISLTTQTFNRFYIMLVTVYMLGETNKKTGIGEQSCLLQP